MDVELILKLLILILIGNVDKKFSQNRIYQGWKPIYRKESSYEN